MHRYTFESVAWVLVKGSAVSEMSQHAQFIRFCANGSILMRKYHDAFAKPMIKMMMASFCERCPLSREGSGQTLKLGECYRSDECLNVQFELIIYSGQRYIFLYTHTRNVPENKETVEKIWCLKISFIWFPEQRAPWYLGHFLALTNIQTFTARYFHIYKLSHRQFHTFTLENNFLIFILVLTFSHLLK